MEKKVSMEVSRIADNLPNAFAQGISKDIEKVVGFILTNYDVYTRGTKCIVNQEELQQVIMTHLNVNSNRECSALTKTGTKCSRKATGKYKYCKLHMQKALMYESMHNHTVSNTVATSINQSDIFCQIMQPVSDESLLDKNLQLHKKFIEDSLYLVDEQFIYDVETRTKVGYIYRNAQGANEYQITDDPFLLAVSH
jgi:hypothetical protein